MPGGALAAISIGSDIIGAGQKNNAAKRAERDYRGATTEANNLQRSIYDDFVGREQPYTMVGQTGATGVNRFLSGDPAQMQAELEGTPGYQFTLAQGLKAVQNSAARRGLGVSGAAMKGASAYATGLADQTFGNQFTRFMDAAKLGQLATGAIGAAGQNYAGAVGNNLLGAAGVQGSASMARAANSSDLMNKLVSGAGAFAGMYGKAPALPNGIPAAFDGLI